MSEANQIHNPTCDNCGEEITDNEYTECGQCGAILCSDCICENCENFGA